MAETFREGSRREWTASDPNVKLNREQIAVGCLQRIADATEVMAQRITTLIESNQHLRSVNAIQKKQLSAAKGQATKLRQRIAALESPQS